MITPADDAPLQFSLEQALALTGRMLASGHLEPAEEMCTVILQNWPNHPDGLHLAGVLRHLQGRYDEAAGLIGYVLSQQPGNPRAHNHYGNVLAKLERIDEACEEFGHAIALGSDPSELADAYCNLSRMHRKQGDLVAAEAAARQSLALKPEGAVAWYNLSLVLLRSGQVREGILATGRSIKLRPRHFHTRDNVIRALVVLGEFDEAAKLYREWLAEEPDNEVVRHQLAACLGKGAPDRASDAYVEKVFDGFADSFDSKLKSLQYRAPELVRDALARVAGEGHGQFDLIDAGCGTGLCGPLLKPWARTLVGVDLSAGMLQKAALRETYDALHKMELVQFLSAQHGSCDVIVSADTLIYFGSLEALMQASAGALRPGGWFIFTIEALPPDVPGVPGVPDGHTLTPSGRYAHGRGYVDACLQAVGIGVLDAQPIVLRMEAAVPVDGWLVTARKG